MAFEYNFEITKSFPFDFEMYFYGKIMHRHFYVSVDTQKEKKKIEKKHVNLLVSDMIYKQRDGEK